MRHSGLGLKWSVFETQATGPVHSSHNDESCLSLVNGSSMSLKLPLAEYCFSGFDKQIRTVTEDILGYIHSRALRERLFFICMAWPYFTKFITVACDCKSTSPVITQIIQSMYRYTHITFDWYSQYRSPGMRWKLCYTSPCRRCRFIGSTDVLEIHCATRQAVWNK